MESTEQIKGITQQSRTETLLTCTTLVHRYTAHKTTYKHKVTLYTLTRNTQYIYINTRSHCIH